MKQELAIGRIRTAHGVRGELKVEPLSGETSHFESLRAVVLVRGNDRHEAEIESVRSAHRAILLKLRGVETPEDAKRWRGWTIVVAREDAAPLGEDEFYYADLVGLHVYVQKAERGIVSAILEGGTSILLEITRADGLKRLVPFQAAFVGEVDLAAGTLEILSDEVLE